MLGDRLRWILHCIYVVSLVRCLGRGVHKIWPEIHFTRYNRAMKLNDILPDKDTPQCIYCAKCQAHMVLAFEDFDERLTGVHLIIKNLPVLKCLACNYKAFPDNSRSLVISLHKKATSESVSKIIETRLKSTTRFGLTKVKFLYDTDDYRYIPGLERFDDSGFLTPVFFNKEVLIKFNSHPEYKVHFASRSYGTICRSNDYDISFGINRNGKLIMWLGDIARLPESEQHFLRSENVASDHDVGSEFYDGQIEVKYTDPPPEDQLVLARAVFLDQFFRSFNVKLDHLSSETFESITSLRPPVVNTKEEMERVIGLLNKINIESIDSKTLRSLLTDRSIDSKGLRSLKRIERLFMHEFPRQGISSMIAPFFIIYDLRTYTSHTLSETDKSIVWKSVCERLGIDELTTYTELYNQLVQRLKESYQALTDLLDRTV